MSVPRRPEDKKGLSALGARISSYFRGVYAEMKKVHWPDRKKVVVYTGVVLVAVALVSVLIWIIDSGLAYAIEILFSYLGK